MSHITVLHACDPANTPVTLHVNGKSVTILNNCETSIPALFADAVRNCSFDIQILGEIEIILGEADEAAADEPVAPTDDGAPAPDSGTSAAAGDGGTDPGGATFDAEAIIVGNVATVAGRLEGLTTEQLEAVKAAELDREQPRAGVSAAIEAAIKAKVAPEGA